MDRTLAQLAAAGLPLEVRLRIACGLARAVAALHRRGAAHGALSPGAVLVAGDGEAVVLSPPGSPDPLALAGWAAPEVIRGARPSRGADAFATAALVQLALTGRGPFDGGDADALERARRALFEPPRPARLDEPRIPAEVEEALARLLERSRRRRGTADALCAALEAAAIAIPTATAAPPPPRAPGGASRGTGRRGATRAPFIPSVAALVTRLRARTRAPFILAVASRMARSRGTLASLARRVPPSPLHRAALAAVPLLAIAVLLVPRSDAALAREVARAIGRRDLAAARAALDRAPRGADRALVEKLRGDLACARRAPDECLRRYRTALAARPALGEDAALRRNVRALLSRGESCGTQRSAALLAGQLRDPEALPALQAARQSAGILAFLCTGDALDRAIAATRASAR